MNPTILDCYPYYIENDTGDTFDIHVEIDSIMDVTIADISTDLTGSDNHIYIDGRLGIVAQLNIDEQNMTLVLTTNKTKGE